MVQAKDQDVRAYLAMLLRENQELHKRCLELILSLERAEQKVAEALRQQQREQSKCFEVETHGRRWMAKYRSIVELNTGKPSFTLDGIPEPSGNF